MAEPSAFLLSKCFTQLISRKVTFAITSPAMDSKIKQVYGIYSVLPSEVAIVVSADLLLLGSIGGALVGLPDAAVKEHLRATPMDELLRDAISEVLNIAAAAVTTDGRAVFKKMVSDPAYIDGPAEKVFKSPFRRNYFAVSVEGYQGGRLAIFSAFVPTRLGSR
jgi:hypothetical protein